MRLKDCGKISRIILALDFIGDNLRRRLSEVLERVAAVKIGLLFLLDKEDSTLLDILIDKKVYILADLKLADIPKIMTSICKKIADKANGVIAHAFVGSQAIRKLRESLNEIGLELFIVTAMTHPGAEEFMNKHFSEFLNMAKGLADGIVAPATFRKYILQARKVLKDKIILSPGIGTQGAAYGQALKSGADFEIIGRAITLAEDPVKETEKINRIHGKIIKANRVFVNHRFD